MGGRSVLPEAYRRIAGGIGLASRPTVRKSPHQACDRLWDLRRGDADDNRASPYGRGWRGVLVATALEFNFLTATLTFFALVIVPLLLVGLAPPLMLIFGRHKLSAAATMSSHPFAAIASIALLVGIGLWIGKPLLSMAVDNFW